tara:strand:+ start:1237 stop:1464 length:228 start_codon:yes stop_codon:yes gene_type:complete
MKTLPTLVTTANLDEILASFTTNPIPGVEVQRRDDYAAVHVTRRKTGKREEILQAIKLDHNEWHVNAVEGMLTPK